MARNKERYAFGGWLKERRTARYSTQFGAMAAFDEAARAMGHERRPISQSQWSDMETGKVFPEEDDLAVLAAMFGDDWPRPPMPLDYERQMRLLLEEERRATRQMMAESLAPLEELMRELVEELRAREP